MQWLSRVVAEIVVYDKLVEALPLAGCARQVLSMHEKESEKVVHWLQANANARFIFVGLDVV